MLRYQIEDYTITKIKALLLSTNMTIQQIGNQLNFPSQSVLGKYFKRVTGKSPKE
ncbi:MAG: helix-turn-helix domain-containing protein [Bacteroidales bacterium]|nr:helix-turn-helix domain-containing protein [Bacteroidales bacterium]